MSQGNKKFVINQHGAWSGLDSKSYHRHDPQLSQAIISFFQKNNATSVLDLGAGMGLYTKALIENGIFASCYDGNIDTQYISEGKCGIVDLSKEIHFSKYDWVLCLEVGEHLPKEYEDILFGNIIRHSKSGIVLSWAVPGQTGDGHVNEQSNSYIKDKMASLGYDNNLSAEKLFREASTLSWFKNTIMVFEPQIIGESVEAIL